MEQRAKSRLTTVRRQHEQRQVTDLSQRIRTGLVDVEGAGSRRAGGQGIPLKVIAAAKGPLGVSKAPKVGGGVYGNTSVMEAAGTKLQQSYNLSLQRYSKAERVYEQETTDPEWVPFRPKTNCLARDEEMFGLDFDPPGAGMGKQASSYLSNMRNIFEVLMLENKPPESAEEAERVRQMLKHEDPPRHMRKCTHQREYEEPQRECRHKKDLQSALGIIVALVGMIPEDAREDLSSLRWVREASHAAGHTERLSQKLRVVENDMMAMHDVDANLMEQSLEDLGPGTTLGTLVGRKNMLEPVSKQTTPTLGGLGEDPTKALQQRAEEVRRLESELNLQRKATQLEVENKQAAEANLQRAIDRTKFLADSILNFCCSTHLLLANWNKPPADTSTCHIPTPPIPKQFMQDEQRLHSPTLHPLAMPSRLTSVLTQMWDNFAAVKDARPNCPVILTNINALLDDCELLPSRLRDGGATTTFEKEARVKKPLIHMRAPHHKLPIQIVTDVARIARRREPVVEAPKDQPADNIFGVAIPSPAQGETFLPELVQTPPDQLLTPQDTALNPPTQPQHLEAYELSRMETKTIRKRKRGSSFRAPPA